MNITEIPGHHQPEALRAPPSQARLAQVGKGVVGDILLWTELYESESLFNHRSHFETFTQWCHSAQLVPFLQRCYRRCGLAGLLPHQRCGGYKQDPAWPLVLPTMVNFCYGHCYPLHKILQYFYGGMTSIVCSYDDPHVVEADRVALGLIAGQERLNNQCWFRFMDHEGVQMRDAAGTQRSPSLRSASSGKLQGGHLNELLLQELEDSMHDGELRNTAAKVGEKDPLGGPSRCRSRSTLRSTSRLSVSDPSSPTLLGKRSSTVLRSTNGRPIRGSVSGSSQAAQQLQLLPKGKNFKHVRRQKVRVAKPGAMVAEDIFFWFCQQNFGLYTFPANKVPRQVLNEGHALTFRYADFVSRTGTPEPRSGRARREELPPDSPKGRASFSDKQMMSRALSDHTFEELQEAVEEDMDDNERFQSLHDNPPVPPSICVVQPTEISTHARQRWEVKKEFVDEKKLILGDTGWFPGALGHRFTFEAKTDDVSLYVDIGQVPQAQLMYIEHLQVRKGARHKDNQQVSEFLAGDVYLNESDNMHSSSSDTDADRKEKPLLRRKLMYPPKRKRERRDSTKDASQAPNLMLPPLPFR